LFCQNAASGGVSKSPDFGSMSGTEHKDRRLLAIAWGRAVPSKAEEYRSKADDCRRRAQEAHDPDAKRQFEELARGWLELAKRAERQE